MATPLCQPGLICVKHRAHTEQRHRIHLRHFGRHYFRIVSDSWSQMRDGGDDKAMYVADGFVKITVNKVLCTRLPPNPCVKGMGSAPAQSDFLLKDGWGTEGDSSSGLHTCTLWSKGCGLTCVGCRCQARSLKSDCLHTWFSAYFTPHRF